MSRRACGPERRVEPELEDCVRLRTGDPRETVVQLLLRRRSEVAPAIKSCETVEVQDWGLHRKGPEFPADEPTRRLVERRIRAVRQHDDEHARTDVRRGPERLAR